MAAKAEKTIKARKICKIGNASNWLQHCIVTTVIASVAKSEKLENTQKTETKPKMPKYHFIFKFNQNY